MFYSKFSTLALALTSLTFPILTEAAGCPATTLNPSLGAPNLDTPANNFVIQRDSSNNGRLYISGSTTVRFGGQTYPIQCVEARVMGHNPNGAMGAIYQWEKISDQTITNGAFSGITPLRVTGLSLIDGDGKRHGFYQVEVRVNIANYYSPSATVSRVGVGEVFVIAGQSNSSWNGDMPESSPWGSFLVPTEMTSSQFFRGLPMEDDQFSSASGPALTGPNIDGSVNWTQQYQKGQFANSGSFWPRLASRLAPELGLPIAFIPLNHGGTSIGQWLPTAGPCTSCSGENWNQYPHYLFDRLVNGIKTLKIQSGGISPRAVIWHQGEAENGNFKNYTSNLNTMITAIRSRTSSPDISFVISKVSSTVAKVAPGTPNCEPLNPNPGAQHFAFEEDRLNALCHFPPLRAAQAAAINPANRIYLGAQADRYGTAYRRNGSFGHMWDGLHFTNFGRVNDGRCSGSYQIMYGSTAHCDGFGGMADEYYMALKNAFFQGSYRRQPNW